MWVDRRMQVSRLYGSVNRRIHGAAIQAKQEKDPNMANDAPNKASEGSEHGKR